MFLKTFFSSLEEDLGKSTIEGKSSTDDFEIFIDVLWSNFEIKESKMNRKPVEPLTNNVIATVEKEDANQAQIFQGWLFPTITSPDYPTIILLNNN